MRSRFSGRRDFWRHRICTSTQVLRSRRFLRSIPLLSDRHVIEWLTDDIPRHCLIGQWRSLANLGCSFQRWECGSVNDGELRLFTSAQQWEAPVRVIDRASLRIYYAFEIHRTRKAMVFGFPREPGVGTVPVFPQNVVEVVFASPDALDSVRVPGANVHSDQWGLVIFRG